MQLFSRLGISVGSVESLLLFTVEKILAILAVLTGAVSCSVCVYASSPFQVPMLVSGVECGTSANLRSDGRVAGVGKVTIVISSSRDTNAMYDSVGSRPENMTVSDPGAETSQGRSHVSVTDQ